MRIGLSTPVVVQQPGIASAWEADADISDIQRVVVTADELGFDYVTCSEHVAVPVDAALTRGATYWDPVATLSYLAATTSRIGLATSVVVAGYHHPLAIAKRYATLDCLSDGRVILGVGVGSLVEEFDVLGACWSDRGRRADDAIRAIRASIAETHPTYRGEFYQFDSVVLQPCAIQPRLPIWVGGHTLRSFRRAVELADGWMPFGVSTVHIAEIVAAHNLRPGFDIVLATGRPIDPLGDAVVARRLLQRLHAIGATAVTCVVAAQSCAHYCDQLVALRQLADELDLGAA